MAPLSPSDAACWCAITNLLGADGRLLVLRLGDSDSNRDCTAPKAGGLPITPSPIRAVERPRRGDPPRWRVPASLGPTGPGSIHRHRGSAARTASAHVAPVPTVP